MCGLNFYLYFINVSELYWHCPTLLISQQIGIHGSFVFQYFKPKPNLNNLCFLEVWLKRND